MPPRWRVLVHPEILGTHQWSMLAALAELRRRRTIELSFARLRPEPWRASALMAVRDLDCGEDRLLAFEMHDEPAFATWNIENADVIYKRSYDAAAIAELRMPGLDTRIRPLGLTLGCRAPGSNRLEWRTTAELVRLKASRRYPLPAASALASTVAAVKATMTSLTGRERGGVPSSVRFYESVRRPHVRPTVTFIVKAWEPTGLAEPSFSDFDRTTEERAELIRALKAELGRTFVGGFVPSEYVKRRYPDCEATVSTTQRDFIRAVATSAVGVSTRGLARSNPWKLAEYLATGVAIVSHPLAYALPTPLIEGDNVLTFTTAAKCVERCVEVLSDLSLLAHVREQNLRYWLAEVRPDRLLERRFSEAFELTS